MQRIIDTLDKNLLVYNGSDGSGFGYQFIYRMPNNLLFSVVCNSYLSDDGMIAIMNVANGGDGIPHPHLKNKLGKQVEFIELQCDSIHFSCLDFYDNERIKEFFDYLSKIDIKHFHVSNSFQERHKRFYGQRAIREMFKNLPVHGQPCASEIDCIYSIRYLEDLHGYIPVAYAYDWEKNEKGRKVKVKTYLVLEKDGKLYVDPFANGYGVHPIPITDMVYPSEIFDFIFHNVEPAWKAKKETLRK